MKIGAILVLASKYTHNTDGYADKILKDIRPIEIRRSKVHPDNFVIIGVSDLFHDVTDAHGEIPSYNIINCNGIKDAQIQRHPTYTLS